MAKKKTKKVDGKELASVGFEKNEKPKTPQEEEIARLLNLGKVNAKHKD